MTGPEPAARLRALHHGREPGDPLVLPGPWDPGSALVFTDAGFAALATPSHGVSAALGHEDGACPADEMFAALTRIARAVDVPVSADIERGYGLPPREIADRLLDTGAVGCNLEDTEGGALVETARQADFLADVRAALGPAPFLNARVDSYLRGVPDPLADALERGRAYLAAGADGVYPFGAPPADLALLADALRVPGRAQDRAPLNALARVGEPYPPHATRITFGGGLASHVRATTAALAAQLAHGPPPDAR